MYFVLTASVKRPETFDSWHPSPRDISLSPFIGQTQFSISDSQASLKAKHKKLWLHWSQPAFYTISSHTELVSCTIYTSSIYSTSILQASQLDTIVYEMLKLAIRYVYRILFVLNETQSSQSLNRCALHRRTFLQKRIVLFQTKSTELFLLLRWHVLFQCSFTNKH
jgi:hypothetical protein